jgi:Bacterial Ig-like domain/Chitobiase/beta-hexosaminidase C-terminal domain
MQVNLAPGRTPGGVSRRATTVASRRPTPRAPKLAALVVGGLMAALLSLAGPAAAAVTTPGMVLTAFHNRDFVTVDGLAPGTDVTVDVVRGGVTIGTTGPAKIPAGGTLEVNHGPAGTPVPGDCWLNVTPDIRPHDVIRVTTANAVDTMAVAGVDVSGQAFLLDNGDVAVEGDGAAADGSRLAPSSFEVGFRNQTPRFRRDPLTGAGAVYQGTTGTTWRAIYHPDGVRQNGDDAAFTVDQQRDLALNGAGWRATSPAGGAGSELTISENDAVNGPGAGCPSAADPNAITAGYTEPVNLTSGDITIGGTAKEGTAAVSVTVKDGAGTALAAKDATLSANATGAKTWSVAVTRAELGTLGDGSLTVTAAFTDGAGATVNGTPRTILKDTVAPAIPDSTPAAGTYRTAQAVSLGLPAGESPLSQIRYTVNGFAPTPTSTRYTGQISVTASQNIRAIVVDPAGNVSPIADFPFVIDNVPPADPIPSVDPGTYKADQSVSLSSEEGATFRYTTNGTTPSGTTGTPWKVGDAPIAITAAVATEKTTTLKAVAIDAAGNVSLVGTFAYTIDKDVPAEPVSTPAGGNFTTAQTVTMTAEPGATIRYTRGLNNATDPTPASGTRYTAPISVSTTATVRAIAIDAAGNVSPVAVETYTINSDATAPTVPTGVTATATGQTAVNVSWTASTDAVGVTGYEVFRNGTLTATVAGTSFADSGLTASTRYSYTVRAFDAAGNRSAQSSAAAATTAAPPDTAPPTMPTGLTAGATSATSVSLSWTASADNVGVAGYRVYKDGAATALKTVTTTSTTDTVTASSTHTYAVQAVDDAGNASAKTATVSVTSPAATPTDTVRPTVTARTPGVNATSFAVGSNVTATLSEAVSGVKTTTVTLQPVGSTGALGAVVPATVGYNGTTRVATLNPTANLTADTKYTATLTSGIKDAAGNPLAATTWSFTTGPAPTVSGRSPGVNATAVGVANNVTATFNEAVSAINGTTVKLQPVTATGALGTAVGATVSYNTTTRVATLDPTANLTADTKYTVTLTNAIKDVAGNPLAATTWSFTTGPAPTVTARTPAANATGVSRTANVTATFGEAVNRVTTTTFTLRPLSSTGTLGTAVTAVVSRNGTTNQWILNPSATLAASTKYRVTLTGGTAGIGDLAGNPLSNATWDFTTGTT